MNNLVFLCGGFVSLTALTLLLNELLAVVSGNELAIGIALAHWLVGIAIGIYLPSSLAARKTVSRIISLPAVMNRRAAPGKSVFSHPLHYLLASLLWSDFVALSGSWLLLRHSRSLFHLLPGQTPGLKTIFLTTLMIFILPGILAGMRFGISLIIAGRSGQDRRGITYIMEALGCLAGGLTVTALTVFSHPPVVALLIAGLLCLTSVILLWPGRLVKYIVFSLAPVLLCLVFIPESIDLQTMAWNYPGFEAQQLHYSPSGHYLLAQRSGEKYLFGNLLPLNSVAGTDIRQNEELPLFALLSHPRPRRILLIGGSGRYVAPILAQDIETLDWFEQDRTLPQLLRTYLPGTVGPGFSDPRLRILAGYSRRHLAKTSYYYDVIIVGQPYPVTMAENRYYTREFFKLANRSLAKGGILAVMLPGSFVYVGPAMTELNTIAWETLKIAFRNVRIIPGEDNIYLASDSLLAAASEIKKRLRGRTSAFMSPAHIDYRMDFEKNKWLRSQVRKFSRLKLNNNDYTPRGLLAGLVYRQSLLEPHTTTVFRFILSWSWLLLLLIPVTAFPRRRYRPVAGTFISGAAGMCLLLISAWGLQALRGDLYRWLATLTALFGACFILGAAASRRQKDPGIILKELVKVEFTFLLWLLLWGIFILSRNSWWQAYFMLPAGTGLLMGLAFPLQGAIYAAATGRNDSSAGGILVSVSALGGWAAGLLAGTVIIPGWGFERTLLLLLVIKLISFHRLLKPR